MNRFLLATTGVALVTAATTPAQARDGTTVTATVERQDLSDHYGSLTTARIEYRMVDEDTTIVVTPRIGERRATYLRDTAVGIEGALYHHWSPAISTRTDLFVAQDNSVFAHVDAAQDVTATIADNTTLTAGARWARYYRGQDVWFASLGARRYFPFGSIAYRLTRTMPEHRDAFFAHLLDVTLKDGRGDGQTRLWLSSGASSLPLSDLDRRPSGQDRGALVQRSQPLTSRVNLIAQAGLSSYDRPAGRITGTNFGLGVSVGPPRP